MKNVILLVISSLVLFGFSGLKDETKVRCMIQLKNYDGEGAYIIVSLMNPKGEYEKTLYVQGEDDQWYHDIDEWWSFYGKERPSLDGITGATIGGGERTIREINIPTDKIDKGYKLRFETSVEDEDYFPTDLEFSLTTENLTSQQKGKGFIRYVRLMKKS